MGSASSTQLVTRSSVVARGNYADYQDVLRLDFLYTCAYCLMMEVEADGVGFEIDHYLPQVSSPNLAKQYENLYWSCRFCNRRKGDYNPATSRDPKTFYVIPIDREDPGLHLQPSAVKDGEVSPKTEIGKFNEDLLGLNRPGLVALRRLRKRMWDSAEYITKGIHEIRNRKLDQVPANLRLMFARQRDPLLETCAEVTTVLSDFLESYVKSSQIQAKKGSENLLAHLVENKAIPLAPKLPRGRKRRR